MTPPDFLSARFDAVDQERLEGRAHLRALKQLNESISAQHGLPVVWCCYAITTRCRSPFWGRFLKNDGPTSSQR
jgi:hypothetical protein